MKFRGPWQPDWVGCGRETAGRGQANNRTTPCGQVWRAKSSGDVRTPAQAIARIRHFLQIPINAGDGDQAAWLTSAAIAFRMIRKAEFRAGRNADILCRKDQVRVIDLLLILHEDAGPA